MTDEHPPVRAAAARALASCVGERVQSALLAATRDPDPWVVTEAVRALGTVGSERALPSLMAAAGSASSPIAIAALRSLCAQAAREIVVAIKKAVRHADPEVVCEAIHAGACLDAATAGPILIELLGHRNWNVRRTSASALAEGGLTVPAEVLSEML
ncbi:MAG: HEAT repeat domain-containing protein [Deltaproteobacteria bacterium]|nr:HEAT repeat domain-containing protein [Deltaproteobacteria bacterium]